MDISYKIDNLAQSIPRNKKNFASLFQWIFASFRCVDDWDDCLIIKSTPSPVKRPGNVHKEGTMAVYTAASIKGPSGIKLSVLFGIKINKRRLFLHSLFSSFFFLNPATH